MKQKTRHHVQRVATGILASILALSGIGAAHAGEKGESKDYKPFACNSETSYTLTPVDASSWSVLRYHVPDSEFSMFPLPSQKSSLISPQPPSSDRPEYGDRGDTYFSTENADYHVRWYSYEEGFAAVDSHCNLVAKTLIHPGSIDVFAHSGKTLSEALIHRELSEKNFTIVGLPVEWDTVKLSEGYQGHWYSTNNPPVYSCDSFFNHETGEVTHSHPVQESLDYQDYDYQQRDYYHDAFSSNNVFYRVTTQGKIERLQGTTWVPLASQPSFPIFSTIPYLNVGVVMVEPDHKTSHFISFADLEKDDFSHIATSTVTIPDGLSEASPFARLYSMAIVEADMKIKRLSYSVHITPVSKNILDDFSRQLGYQLPSAKIITLTDTSGDENALSIPLVTVSPVTQPATDLTGKPVLPEASPHTSVTLTETPESWIVTARALDGYRFTNGEYSHRFTYPHFYKLFYQPNEGEGEPVEERVAYGKQSHNPVRFHRPGYQFVGWNTRADGSGTTVTTPTVTTDTTLYAQWRKAVPQTVLTPAHKTERSVRFHSNDKRDTVITVHATDGDTVSLKTGLTRAGYVLTGWATSPEGSTLAYPATGRLTVDGDSDLYAVWKPVSTGSKPAPQAATPAQEKPSSRPRVVSETSAKLASTGSMVSSVALLAMVLVTVGLSTVLLVRRKQ